MLDRITPSTARTRAFTIVELLVVIGVIGILALLTTLGARRLTQGSRLAAATNAVTSALGNARAAAIKDGVATGVVFRPVYNPQRPNTPQRVELITIRSTGERQPFPQSPSSDIGLRISERFRPVQNIPAVVLPEGVKVAGPMYDPPGSFGSIPAEQVFATQAELVRLTSCAETIEFNRVVAVLFGSDGQFLTRPGRGSIDEMKCYVDWNDNGQQQVGASAETPVPGLALGTCGSNNFEWYWLQDGPDDENNLMFVPFLSIYDDKAAREQKGTDWGVDSNVLSELTGPTGFIAQFGDRITFNRFSGIPERKLR